MNVSLGSPLWQVALVFFAVVLLCFEAWSGWRAGVARAGINFGAFVISSIFGLLAAQAVSALFGGGGSPAGLAAGAIAGLAIGLGIFVVIWLVGALLFKRTAHHAGLFRLLWGAGGSFFGILTGLLLLWGCISAIRLLGAMGEGTAEAASAHQIPPPKAAKGLVTLKESLELGTTGDFLKSVDPIPPDLYQLVTQITRLTADSRAMVRFIEYPGIQNVLNHPRMADLLSDPEVIRAAEQRNFLALLSNKSLHAALEDPSLAEELRKVDLRGALAYALTPSPEERP
jgi:hypothetical protein